jgi:hypothetical protein
MLPFGNEIGPPNSLTWGFHFGIIIKPVAKATRSVKVSPVKPGRPGQANDLKIGFQCHGKSP